MRKGFTFIRIYSIITVVMIYRNKCIEGDDVMYTKNFEKVIRNYLENLGSILGESVEFEFRNDVGGSFKLVIDKLGRDKFKLNLDGLKNDYHFSKEMPLGEVMHNLLLEREKKKLICEADRERIKKNV